MVRIWVSMEDGTAEFADRLNVVHVRKKGGQGWSLTPLDTQGHPFQKFALTYFAFTKVLH